MPYHAQIAYTTSAGAGSWSKSAKITNAWSNYGLQMANYRGELYGIMTQSNQYPNQLFATKFKTDGGWKLFYSLPQNWRAQGRVAVAVLDDRFYMAYRGMDNGVYLTYTEDFKTWKAGGRVGSQYSKTFVSPGLAAYGGDIYVTGVGGDKYIYYTVTDKDCKRTMSWQKIDGTGTRSALAMTVYDGTLSLFHTAYNNGKFYYQTFSKDGWSELIGVSAPGISSGVSVATWKYNEIAMAYKGSNEDICTRYFNGERWTQAESIPGGVYMQYQTGLATWGGKLFVSFGVAEKMRSADIRDCPVSAMELEAQAQAQSQPRMSEPRAYMSEKSGFVTEQEVDDDQEWDVKWNQSNKKKSMIKKWFCM